MTEVDYQAIENKLANLDKELISALSTGQPLRNRFIFQLNDAFLDFGYLSEDAESQVQRNALIAIMCLLAASIGFMTV